MSNEAGCGRCDARFGARAAHCGGCCRTFSSVTLFDRHRSGVGTHGRCLDPARLDGLEFRDGMWRGPALSPDEVDSLRERTSR